MMCPECGSETRTNELYCRVCGTEIRLTYDQVHDTLSDEIQQDKETATEMTMRMMALWMGFFMIVAITLDITSQDGLISEEYPEKAYQVPVYSSRNDLVRPQPFEDRSVDLVAEVEERIKANEVAERTGESVPKKKGK